MQKLHKLVQKLRSMQCLSSFSPPVIPMARIPHSAEASYASNQLDQRSAFGLHTSFIIKSFGGFLKKSCSDHPAASRCGLKQILCLQYTVGIKKNQLLDILNTKNIKQDRQRLTFSIISYLKATLSGSFNSKVFQLAFKLREKREYKCLETYLQKPTLF